MSGGCGYAARIGISVTFNGQTNLSPRPIYETSGPTE